MQHSQRTTRIRFAAVCGLAVLILTAVFLHAPWWLALAAIAAVTFAAVWRWQRRPAYRRNWMEYFDHIISGGIRYQQVSFVTVIVVEVEVCILLAIWPDCSILTHEDGWGKARGVIYHFLDPGYLNDDETPAVQGFMLLISLAELYGQRAGMVNIGAAMDAMRVDSWKRMMYLMLILGFLGWPSIARLVRGQILSLREQEYVLAAQATGAKGRWIITRHLVPNCMSVIFISTALQIPNAIFTESFLSYLGLGVNAPMPSLGSLASDALNGITSYPYRMVIPALIISLIVLSLNLFGDGLRDAFDPKMKR